MTPRNPLRELPSVDQLLGSERLSALAELYGRELVLQAARGALARAREDIQAGFEPGDIVERAEAEAARLLAPRLRRVLNATGVVVHTNLGRAPLAPEALARVEEVGGGYSNLEFELESGARGSRQDHVAATLREVTGAEAALVVNNNAAAVLLALAALAEGREVLVSRGELVEIGDGFRIPDVLARSGAKLVEVGTTNRTRLTDYEHALTERTAVILRVHQSNFRIVGFTEQTQLRELARLAERAGVLLVDDLGSGVLTPLGDEPTVSSSLEGGSHLVTFSGDKLLGGPQAGVLAGRADAVDACARHPLARALRPGGLVLGALQATALAYLRADGDAIPFWRMAAAPVDGLRARAEALGVGKVVDTVAVAGGGSVPGQDVPSAGVALDGDHAAALRRLDPPIVARVHEGMTICDLRTVDPLDDPVLAAALASCT